MTQMRFTQLPFTHMHFTQLRFTQMLFTQLRFYTDAYCAELWELILGPRVPLQKLNGEGHTDIDI